MATDLQHIELARLQALYSQATPWDFDPNTGPFWEAFEQIDWSDKDAEFYRALISMTWMLGAGKLAWKIAQEGLARFPDDSALQKSAAIIAPGVARVVPHEGPRPNHAATNAWFKEHGSEYRGQWVAVHDGTFMGAAPTLKELMEQLKQKLDDVTRRNTLVTRIL